MNISQLRQKIDSQLNTLSPEWLALISSFLDSIQTMKSGDSSSVVKQASIKRGKQAQDLLKYANTWQGDDLEDCLDSVRETRSEAQF
ncbi:MAG: hypothetical protein WA919_19870 [Coleofasciculaceae cyanobacterium]